MRFFSYDSKFGQLFIKLSYGCCLNILWLVCSLPIITIGASTTALYYTSFKIAKDEGSFITTMFFRSFRQNFKQATIIWMIMLAVGLAIGADAILLFQLDLFPILQHLRNGSYPRFTRATRFTGIIQILWHIR